MQTTRKIESNIFPVFYSFHRIYTKMSMIFESVYNFYTISHIKHFLNKKEKEKAHCAKRSARLVTAQVGPRAFPRRVRVLSFSHGH